MLASGIRMSSRHIQTNLYHSSVIVRLSTGPVFSYCDWPLSAVVRHAKSFLCPGHSKNGGGALSVTPVRACVRALVRASVRPSDIKIWCPLDIFWKTALIQFKFGMWIYNIKTQVKFDLGYNPLIFDGVMGLL